MYAMARRKPIVPNAKALATRVSSGVQGNENTKASQAYTREFGASVLDTYIAHSMDQHQPPHDLSLDDVEIDDDASEIWEHADLVSVLRFATHT